MIERQPEHADAYVVSEKCHHVAVPLKGNIQSE
jgi:hypothetical protein